ncbi:MAG: threonine synthase [Haloquadratum sp. J07HQX50]|nr:MAG: threonine synthase [Haloquadratum sp. J07HQX50]
MLTDSLILWCPACEQRYTSRWAWRCGCGHPLEFENAPLASGSPPTPSAPSSLWAFQSLLPVTQAVSLGAGMTPLVNAPKWDARFKLEYISPTGSFKDRGAATTIAVAAELGIETLVEDSSGNAGTAIATYAAAAGIDAKIYVPSGIKAGKRRAIEQTGATICAIEGERVDATEACLSAVEQGEGWYGSHAWNPAFFAGTATFAYEVCLQREWTAPDAVVLPVGHGTLFLGAYRGFSRLRAGGWIDSLPQLFAAQASGYAPVVESNRTVSQQPNGLADGIHIRNPPRGHQISAAIDDTGGSAIAITEEALTESLDQLHTAGFYTEPTCAVAPAALRQLRASGAIESDADVVVPLTGSGHHVEMPS